MISRLKRSGSPLSGILPHGAVATSEDLIERLSHEQRSPEAARQILGREYDAAGLWRSEKLALPGGGRLFGWRDERGQPFFLEAVAKRLGEERPGIARCLDVVSREGVIGGAELARLLSSPLAMVRGSRRHLDEEIAAICELGLAVEGRGTRWERVIPEKVVGTEQSTALALRAYARLERERRLTRLLVEHLRRQSLLAWHGSRIPDLDSVGEGFSNFAFSAWGYSWLAPLVRNNRNRKPGPTPVLIDVFARMSFGASKPAIDRQV